LRLRRVTSLSSYILSKRGATSSPSALGLGRYLVSVQSFLGASKYLNPVVLKKLNLSFLRFALTESPALSGYPRVAVAEPLKPRVLSFLKIIFRIPAVPSASYLAEGEVITSTLSMASAGN